MQNFEDLINNRAVFSYNQYSTRLQHPTFGMPGTNTLAMNYVSSSESLFLCHVLFLIQITRFYRIIYITIYIFFFISVKLPFQNIYYYTIEKNLDRNGKNEVEFSFLGQLFMHGADKQVINYIAFYCLLASLVQIKQTCFRKSEEKVTNNQKQNKATTFRCQRV